MSEALFICRECREVKPASAMKRAANGKISQSCKGCANEYARERRAEAPRPSLSIDPCPVCHVAQAEHWRCRICTSRGHQMGRGRIDPTLCAWCEDEQQQGAQRWAA